LSFVACAPVFEGRDWSGMGATQRQAALSEITRKCGLPADRLLLLEDGEVRLKPGLNDSYEALDCALTGLNALRGISLGFVGNEYLANEVD
jgi:hypothetical protein